MDQQKMRHAMLEAIREAGLTPYSPDAPRVGAVLCDSKGEIILTAHRGEEIPDAHAEFHLFRKADQRAINVRGCVLFVTLEPCTRRGPEKVPCAVRVAESGLRKVVIGTLDPNPLICGRGECFLGYQMDVDRFPPDLAKKLRSMNREFFDKHRNSQIPVVSPYAGRSSVAAGDTFRPVLSGQREGILQQSMDLMSGSNGEIQIFAGDLSWLRELQITLVLARRAGRRIRVLCDKTDRRDERFLRLVDIASRLGADVGLTKKEISVRGTLVSGGTETSAMILVERQPTKHPMLLQCPHERGLLDFLTESFEDQWGASEVCASHEPQIVTVEEAAIVSALRRNVPQYKEADIQIQEVDLGSTVPITSSLERFKLFRLSQVASFQFAYRTEVAVIRGSPWPVLLPVVEAVEQGRQVVIDGAHRIYSALERGVSKMAVVVVSRVREPLPARPQESWDCISVAHGKVPRDSRYADYRKERFRPIRTAWEDLALRF